VVGLGENNKEEKYIELVYSNQGRVGRVMGK
jgi:hypothetical protein